MSVFKLGFVIFLAVMFHFPVNASQGDIVPSPETLRKLAYGHEFKTLEAVLEKLQEDVLAKRVSYAEQRDVYKVLSVLHPDMIKAVDAWRVEMPDSVHARAIRARILFYAGWNMRGFKVIRDTYPEALSQMNRMHTEGMALAQSAFNARPDIVPVSDAVIWLEQTVPVVPSWIDRLSGDTPFKRIMRLTPNHRTLQGKLWETEPIWGGSFQQASDLCDTYAPMVKDVEGYTPEICKAEAIYTLDYETEELFVWAQQVLDKTDNPVLDRARWIDAVTKRPLLKGAEERRTKFIPALKLRDINKAMTFDSLRNYSSYLELQAFTKLAPRVYAINHARAVRELEHDPYNRKLLHVLLTPLVGGNKAEHQLEWPVIEDYRRRLLVFSPYNSGYWVDYAEALEAAREREEVSGEVVDRSVKEYYQNAVVYSNYSMLTLFNFAAYSSHEILTDIRIKDPSVELQDVENHRDETSFIPKEITAQNEHYFCSLLQTDRLINHICKIRTWDGFCQFDIDGQKYNKLVYQKVKERGACETELTAPIEKVLFQTTSYDWQVPPLQ